MIKLFKTHSEKVLKAYNPLLNAVLALENEYSKLTDAQLQAKTQEFKNRYKNGESLDSLLPEAFATCREAAWRTLGMKHYPVQIQGGIALYDGKIAEMKTGEGKTLVVTLPAYLNAITGQSTHIVTVNEYLAERDSEWMGQVFRFLGLSVGFIFSGQNTFIKKHAYQSNIVYGTNSEFAFDYLRDHMAHNIVYTTQGPLDYAIVDEVDSILIDEARTPLIISSPSQDKAELYKGADEFVRSLGEEDYDYVEKDKVVSLTEKGVTKAETFFNIGNLSDIENINILHHINAALKAHYITKRDIDYIVKDNEIIIVDSFTGRLAKGKVYSDGLHQAIEAKEGLETRSENTIDATISYQNYFRLYKKICGMTGTAMTEKDEFWEIYGLECIEIPTNKPVIRKDEEDLVYKTEKGKFKAIIKDIKERYEKGQPVLVGTANIEKSELVSAMLKKEGLPHQVLNAKYHEKEAFIVAQAGRYKMITIATNMAGRGTDILLGGNPEMLAKKSFQEKYRLTVGEATAKLHDKEITEDDRQKFVEMLKDYNTMLEEYKIVTEKEKQLVIELGGLYVLGTERHEARRIDNQLRGRAGRQGDPGESRFYLSLEDDLLRVFGGDRVKMLAETMSLGDEVPLTSRMLSGIVERAQKTLEGINFEKRKSLLAFDSVINSQRTMVYRDREKLLKMDESELEKHFKKLAEEELNFYIQEALAETGEGEKVDFSRSIKNIQETFRISIPKQEYSSGEELHDKVWREIEARAVQILDSFEDPEKKGRFMQKIILKTVDRHWKEHIENLARLREGIGLRSIGNQDPIVAYRKESYDMYENMLDSIAHECTTAFFNHGQEEQKAAS
jgi:preprotein translocase subunit SecA